MAYTKSRRSAVRPLRRNSRFVKKRTVRRSTVRRSYRRPGRRPGMTRKRILNITSRKKQDNMRSMFTTPFGSEDTPGPIVMTGDNSYEFLWIASARDNVIAGTEPGVFQTSQRTATSCFMRGLKERWEVQTGSPAQWQHRRIVFTYTGDEIIRVNDDPTDGVGELFKELSTGYVRAFPSLYDVTDPRTQAIQKQVYDRVFKGTRGRDWINTENAKVDTDKVRVLYDKVSHIRSSNDRGVITRRNFWHPLNRTLVYDDDENGNSTVNSPFSVENPKSLGDVYVYDLFSAGLGSTEDDELQITAQATLYWHER